MSKGSSQVKKKLGYSLTRKERDVIYDTSRLSGKSCTIKSVLAFRLNSPFLTVSLYRNLFLSRVVIVVQPHDGTPMKSYRMLVAPSHVSSLVSLISASVESLLPSSYPWAGDLLRTLRKEIQGSLSKVSLAPIWNGSKVRSGDGSQTGTSITTEQARSGGGVSWSDMMAELKREPLRLEHQRIGSDTLA